MTPSETPSSCAWATPLELAAILAVLAFQLWTLTTSLPALPPVVGRETDYFNLLSRGFLNGQLSLDTPVSETLRTAPDPYDPAKRPPGSALHDTAYYGGKYYIYFGVGPVVTLLLPFMAVTGRDLPLPYAVLFFCVAGYLALAACLLHLKGRHHPNASAFASLAGLLLLGFATPLSLLLRRHSLYELPVASGCFFVSVSLYFLLRALSASRPSRWWAGAGLALGLAVASRPIYIVCAPVFLVPLLLGDRSRVPTHGRRELLSAAGPFALVLAGVMAYNVARFGNPFEFGLSYQLSGVVEAKIRHFSAAYAPVNVWAYFLAPLRWGRYFPFLHGIAPTALPGDHGPLEAVYGVFPALPFTLLVAATAYGAFEERRRQGAWGDGGVAIGVIAWSVFSCAAFLCFFYYAAGRYMGDFLPGLMLLAALGYLAMERVTWIRWAGALACLLSLFCGVLLSFESYDKLRQWSPQVYRAIGHALDLPLHWVDGRRGIGPLQVKLGLPQEGTPCLLLETGWPPETDQVFLERSAEGKVRFSFVHGPGSRPMVSPWVAASASDEHVVEIGMGSLYPPALDPFFDGMAEAEVSYLKNRLQVSLDGVRVWDEPAQFFDGAPECTRVSYGTAESRRAAVPTGSETAWPGGGVRLRVPLSAGMNGRSLPLVTTGRQGQGDAIFIRFLDGQKARFGYDHWGKPSLESDPVALEPDREQVFEVWSAGLTGHEAPLVVRLNGREVWRVPADAYPRSPFEVYPARNVIGATSCETTLDGARWEPIADSP